MHLLYPDAVCLNLSLIKPCSSLFPSVFPVSFHSSSLLGTPPFGHPFTLQSAFLDSRVGSVHPDPSGRQRKPCFLQVVCSLEVEQKQTPVFLFHWPKQIPFLKKSYFSNKEWMIKEMGYSLKMWFFPPQTCFIRQLVPGILVLGLWAW